MSFLTGPMRKHVNGHKELTDHSELKRVGAGELVYIPLINMGSTTVEVLVKEGDAVKVGTKVASRNDHFKVPLFSSVSGTVKGIEKVMHTSLRPIEHLVIINDGKYEEEAPLTPLDYKSASKEELVEFMMNMGLVGCGGAGFPTYIKYRGIKGIKTLIINAVECEPYLTGDYAMMHEALEDLVAGVDAMLKMCEAEKAKVCIKETKKDFIPVLKEAFKELDKAEVVAVPDVYPMGWERLLVKTVTGKEYNFLPSEAGVIVNNVQTVIALGHALLEGKPLTRKLVTVSGDGIASPCNIWCPIGTPAKTLIDACGGYTAEDVNVVPGGPMCGRAALKDEFPINAQMGAICVFKYKPIKAVACLRCGACSDHCPMGLQPVELQIALKQKDTDRMAKLKGHLCMSCGMCSYICPSKIDVTGNMNKMKLQLKIAQMKK